MEKRHIPELFWQLQSEGCIKKSDVLHTQDGFCFVYKSLSDILAEKQIFDVPASDGGRLLCDKFFDDWFLYAVQNEANDTYSLLKFREQEHDGESDSPADGDTPGVTISFISFACELLLECLANPTDENRMKLDGEINRVVARRGQWHHKALKGYFVNPHSEGPYLVAGAYTKHIAGFAKNGYLEVPEHYQKIVKQRAQGKHSAKLERVPLFIEALNQEAGRVVCDHEKIYIGNPNNPDSYESAAILATHTGNTSLHSFAAEVVFHARFLVAPAKIRIPFVGSSIYDSAIRADMSIGDTELQGFTPYYRENSRIVRKQYECHKDKKY